MTFTEKLEQTDTDYKTFKQPEGIQKEGNVYNMLQGSACVCLECKMSSHKLGTRKKKMGKHIHSVTFEIPVELYAVAAVH